LQSKEFENWILSSSEESLDMYEMLLNNTITLIKDQLRSVDKAYHYAPSNEIQHKIKEIVKFPEQGNAFTKVLNKIKSNLLAHSLFVSHPSSIAHLHCPVVIPALVAEVIITALNQSMDSWDQSPSATYAEEELINLLVRELGYTSLASGVFTSGGTQSNYMGLLLARNKFCLEHFNVDVNKTGLPTEARKMRIICSEHAHFTVQQSASQLGLGADSVISISANDKFQLSGKDVRDAINKCKEEGLIPFAVVATAGTTDFGSIDLIDDISSITQEEGVWLHVDAAYGGALLFSNKYKCLLKGIEKADSITMDFHKLFYQPISCGAFFVKNKSYFQAISLHADYLNPEEDSKQGILNLVDRSTQTTKRFDALKLILTFQLIGRKKFGELIESTIHTAREVSEYLRGVNNIEVLNKPEINALVFRYLPKYRLDNYVTQLEFHNTINKEIQRIMYEKGKVIMAKTKFQNAIFLKFTILNPLTTYDDLVTYLDEIIRLGKELEQKEELKHECSICS
jgi:L-2,4-diaminobutyrate decarboxylase